MPRSPARTSSWSSTSRTRTAAPLDVARPSARRARGQVRRTPASPGRRAGRAAVPPSASARSRMLASPIRCPTSAGRRCRRSGRRPGAHPYVDRHRRSAGRAWPRWSAPPARSGRRSARSWPAAPPDRRGRDRVTSAPAARKPSIRAGSSPMPGSGGATPSAAAPSARSRPTVARTSLRLSRPSRSASSRARTAPAGLVLHRHPGGGHVQQGDGEAVRDHVVQLPGDPVALLGPRAIGEVGLGRPELGRQRELVADQEPGQHGRCRHRPSRPPSRRPVRRNPLDREQDEAAGPEAQRSPAAAGQGAPHAQDGEREPTDVAGAPRSEDRHPAGGHDRPHEHRSAPRDERDRARSEGNPGRGRVEGHAAGQPHGEGRRHEGREGADGHPPRPW